MDKPFLHTYLIIRIKSNNRSHLIDKKTLYEEISRALIRQHGGLPKFTIKYVIDDLVKLGYLKKENKVNLYLINEYPEEKKVKQLIEGF